MEAEALFGVALVILSFGAISRRAERSPLTPPMFFIAAGCLVSEHGLGLFEPSLTDSVVQALAEFTLVVVLFTDASRIDLSCLRSEEQSLLNRLLQGQRAHQMQGVESLHDGRHRHSSPP